MKERDIAEVFAENLSAALADHEDSARVIAQRANMGETVLSDYRRGTREPSIGRAARIARAVGVSLDELVTDRRAVVDRLAEDLQDLPAETKQPEPTAPRRKNRKAVCSPPQS